jgi:cell division protein FtsI/penicillin-binding protein 2
MNRMSPVQGAMIAAAVVNDGKLVMPYVVDSMTDQAGNEVYRGETIDNGNIMSPSSAKKVRELMEETVISGTSRKSFLP